MQALHPNLKENIFIVAIYLGVWILMYFEAYGLRLRRLISSFFYRKREKKRVLFLYNEMLKKRKGYLRAMRRRVRKQVSSKLQHKKDGNDVSDCDFWQDL